MESWRKVFREGFAPHLPLKGLVALERALRGDDPRILQRATTKPPPLIAVHDWPVEAADPIAFCLWQGADVPEAVTVGQLEEWWARGCFDAEQEIGEQAGSRWFTNWIDETPREEVFAALLPETQAELSRRRAGGGEAKAG